MELQGARCVITGASSGIGLATAKALAAAGGRVLAAARRTEPIAAAGIPGLTAFSCDLSAKDGVDALFEKASEELGGIDLFPCNAGFAYCERCDAPDWGRAERIFELNAISPIYSFERLRKEKGSQAFRFLVTASAMSFMSLPGYALYGGTKAAVHMFARTAAYELGPGQSISVIYPVATKTSFFDVASTEYLPWPAQEPDKVATAILRGIRRDRREIYPLGLFRVMKGVFAFLPFARRAYLRGEWAKTGLAGKVAR
jgi:Short-chain dehydrogenases of various substrate specificities